MESSSILEFLENKAILVTGGTGFLAKIFVEKVLRTQPNVKKLYLLLRAADKKSASLRLQNEIIGKDLFKVLKQKTGANFESLISEKIAVVPGDITCKDLGIKDPKLGDELMRDTDVIVNLAATTKFIERYDVSLYVNTFGAKYILDFAKKCPNLKVVVQVSTAYVSGEKAGHIKEDPYYMGDTLNGRSGLDIEVEKKLIEAKLQELQDNGATEKTTKITMKDMGMERSRHWGWPNVYVFTKALGEMVLMQEKEDIPLVIVRPTIVTSTYKEPMPGWVEGVRTVDSIIVPYGKGKLTYFPCDLESIIDMIPGDMVVNAIITAMEAHANRAGDPIIYHIGSSLRHPVKFRVIHDTSYQYFTKHPWINKDGRPVIVSHVKVLDSVDSFKRYLTLRYLLPLKGLKIANTVFCQCFRDTYMDMSGKINHIMQLQEVYKPYLFFKTIYDDQNMEKLRAAANDRGAETGVFYFDPKAFDWEDYLINIHIPGLVKYVFD
ncbi:hypothetical protein Cgig2_028691 [Carnegiea gigantea]|uniref:Fatty acyl-CoA reductase n=1 Tax=Carnegiea gigantea TaxID=171969 RepID=A0A9Q1QFT6_9CARY|nr:hypothetical protein Cgig2_028691 [Carnegiea gigantea]